MTVFCSANRLLTNLNLHSSATRITTTVSPSSLSVAQSNVGGNGGAAGGQTGAGGQTLGNGGSRSGSTPTGPVSTITSTRFTAAATSRHVVGWHPGWVVVVVAVVIPVAG